MSTGPTQGTAPVARPLARLATARDAARLGAHEDAARYGWTVEYDGDVLVTVGLLARAAAYPPERTDRYTVTLNCDSYDVWPPETRFVNPATGTYVLGADTHVLPTISGLTDFALHPAFSGFFQAGRVDQLVCFSYTRGYYDSSHQPQPHQRWRQGRHWLYSTVRFLHRALQPPYYQGRTP